MSDNATALGPPDAPAPPAGDRSWPEPGQIRTTGRWLGPPERPLMGWLSMPAAGPVLGGVLICPPVGYEYWSAHRTLRTIAERLASEGHAALRLDYDGTGDSAGDGWDERRLDAWRRSVAVGASELRRLGSRRLVLVGVRLGATLALERAGELHADLVVAWRPVTSGRRFARELRMISVAVPEEEAGRFGAGAIVAGGTVFGGDTLADLSALELPRHAPMGPPETVVIGDGADRPAVESLRAAGWAARHVEVAGSELALERPAEYATVPDELVRSICDQVRAGARRQPVGVEPGGGATSARIAVGSTSIQEEIVRLGEGDLVGILSRPARRDPTRPTFVFLNTGSEPHVGPGRAWVEYARALAAGGHPALRVDFSGWGESPDRGHAPGRPYDPHCAGEVIELVRALRQCGHQRVVLVGLCASAWVALRAVLSESVAGVVALNPQLYWQPGHPVEALMSETRARRAPQRAREERGRRWRLWTLLDLIGHRPWAGRWLDELARGTTPVLLLFAEGDDGIEYLRNRLARRLRRAKRRGRLRSAELADIDHSMQMVWRRPLVVEALREFSDGLDDGATREGR